MPFPVHKLLTSAFLCVGSLLYTANLQAFVQNNCRASLRHIEAGGIGYDNGYTTLALFFAPDPRDVCLLPFLDLRGHVFDDGRMAANVGLGYRTFSQQRIYGINLYYDYRNAPNISYNQLGAGIEALGKEWDFRLNGYFPVSRKIARSSGPFFVEFAGNSLFLAQDYDFAMKGADAEVGYHFGKSRLLDFYAAGGPYYYLGHIGTSTLGVKARVAGMFKDYVTLEVSDSYDNIFHNNLQCQITFTLPFGGSSVQTPQAKRAPCPKSALMASRMVQDVAREEIIVQNNQTLKTAAIDPLTGQPFFFVFVNNTSSSAGTFESPYPTLTEAQNNSSAHNIIYVFPGDGTTTGMNEGITLKDYQKFWGSGISHSLQTSQGVVSIPKQSTSAPLITNTDIDTDGNAITLATHNAISGVTIRSALNDAIYGTNPQNLEVSSCLIETSTTYAIEAIFSDEATISITNNQFSNNVNGLSLTLNETATISCLNNTFEDQTSPSSVPLEIIANNNIFSADIENNIFDDNNTGSVRFNFNNIVDADIRLLNNRFTNNGTGTQSTLGSNVVIIANGTNDACTLVLNNNTFSGNTSNSLYMHTSGAITTLDVTASTNTMSSNGGSALVLATPSTTLRVLATGNIISGCSDHGIAVISGTPSTNGTITINNNSLTEIGGHGNGIVVNQDFTNLVSTISNNTISNCEGTGILSYAPAGINSWTLNISNNTISHCQNLPTNAASGISIEQYTNLTGTVMNNTLSDNTGTTFVISSTLLTAPTVCVTLTGNSNTSDYVLINPGDGVYRLSPCDAETLNTGTINKVGTIDSVQSCASLQLCSTDGCCGP